jgi:hypothetical protein
MFVPGPMQQPIVYTQIQTQAPSVGWAVQEDRLACAAPGNDKKVQVQISNHFLSTNENLGFL